MSKQVSKSIYTRCRKTTVTTRHSVFKCFLRGIATWWSLDVTRGLKTKVKLNFEIVEEWAICRELERSLVIVSAGKVFRFATCYFISKLQGLSSDKIRPNFKYLIPVKLRRGGW